MDDQKQSERLSKQSCSYQLMLAELFLSRANDLSDCVNVDTHCQEFGEDVALAEDFIQTVDIQRSYEDGGSLRELLHRECLERFMFKNEPFILPGHLEADNWRSRKEWVIPESGKPDLNFLKQTFGSAEVSVADCEARHYNSQSKVQMRLDKYIEYWSTLIAEDYDYAKHKCLYLKDWHFTRDFPNYEAYNLAPCFESDWLNEFWDARGDSDDDYRFVYMGPKGSWTPLHTDVFSSYSWSANVCGIKRWIMFPPEEDVNLRDALGNLPYDVTSQQMTDPKLYPRYGQIRKRFEVLQHPGDIIFVPSKWLHQVFNEEDTISINHNWFNGCNICIIWESLVTAYEEVKKEISDCRDMDGWHRQCQIILRASHGMDFDEFLLLLLTIARLRIEKLQKTWSEKTIRAEFSKSKLDDKSECVSAVVDKIEQVLQIVRSVPSDLSVALACLMAPIIFDLKKIQLTLSSILSQYILDWDDVFGQSIVPYEHLIRIIKDFLIFFQPICLQLVDAKLDSTK